MPRTAEFTGTMRQQVVVEQASETAGDAVVTWTTIATFDASMRALGGSEATGLTAEVIYEFRTHWRQDVTVGPRQMRLRLAGGTRNYNLTAAFDPTGERQQLVLHATELV